jgi:CcmD family protein
MHKFVVLILINILWLHHASAQANSLDFLRSTGKIYAVVIVILVIFLGLTYFLYNLDRKLTKLENQIKNEQ